MSITNAPSSLLRATKTYFAQNFKPEMSWVNLIAFRESSEFDAEVYPWLGQPPQMEQFKDELVFTPLSDTSYTVTNVTYASGLEFRKEDIDDNKSGTIRMRILQQALTASAHPNKILTSAITNGNSSTLGLCYDGVEFFKTAHPARGAEGGTQSNLLTGTGSSTAQFATDFAAARAAMLNFSGENGEPFWANVPPELYVMVPPGLEKPAREALQAQVISQTTNIQMNMAGVIVNPRLTGTDANDWYMFGVNAAMKPFIFQEREALSFTSQEDPATSDAVFSRRVYRYQCAARYAVGYGFWQAGIKTTNS